MDYAAIPRWPEMTPCPEDHGDTVPKVTFYRGFLIHHWGEQFEHSWWCVTPWGDLAGVPSLLSDEYVGSHWWFDDDNEEHNTRHKQLFKADPTDWIDAQWKAWDDAVAAIDTALNMPPDPLAWYPNARR